MVILSLGVMNIQINCALSSLANENERGGLVGVMESIESLSGLVAPIMAGLIHKLGDEFPVVFIGIIYACIFISVKLFYSK